MLFIGTSNVVLPGPKRTFPERYRSYSRLAYYSVLFNTVEINSTFYKVPLYKTLERWASETTTPFRFTVKLWRNITHQKELQFAPDDVRSFMTAVSALNKKRGCLLVQFPASITEEYFDKVQSILECIRDADTDHCWRVFVEFRHVSWYTVQTCKMLSSHHASVVMHDMHMSATPGLETNSKTMYLRFHGPDGKYGGSYSKKVLDQYSHRINDWMLKGKDVYVYFNNTLGSAYENALLLRSMCEEKAGHNGNARCHLRTPKCADGHPVS